MSEGNERGHRTGGPAIPIRAKPRRRLASLPAASCLPPAPVLIENDRKRTGPQMRMATHRCSAVGSVWSHIDIDMHGPRESDRVASGQEELIVSHARRFLPVPGFSIGWAKTQDAWRGSVPGCGRAAHIDKYVGVDEDRISDRRRRTCLRAGIRCCHPTKHICFFSSLRPLFLSRYSWRPDVSPAPALNCHRCGTILSITMERWR